MKITKYPQSCLLVETGGVKILFDPGNLKYEDRFFEVFDAADAIFITHKHPDHCDANLLQTIAPEAPLYLTGETLAAHPSLGTRAAVIREGDEIPVGPVSVRAVRAIHGYHPRMKGNEVLENVGYLVDDRQKKLYITGDTICFPSDIKADILAIPVTGHGATMTAFEASLFALETGAKQILLTHMDNAAFEVDLPYIEKHFNNAGLPYLIPGIGESVESD